MSRCLVIQHLEPEEPYRIADALRSEGVEVATCAVFAGDALPLDLTGHDALVVMGGSMSATDDTGFPSRRAELRLVQEALDLGVPTLGVCLGAQLLAVAGGARVYRGESGAEIGWMPVTLSADAGRDVLFAGIGSPIVVLHWHGDTFDLPPGATHLARSAKYQNQGFRLGACAWGLQFHLEVDESAVEAFLGCFGGDAVAAGVAPDTISASTAAALGRLAPVGATVLGRFADLVRARAVR